MTMVALPRDIAIVRLLKHEQVEVEYFPTRDCPELSCLKRLSYIATMSIIV